MPQQQAHTADSPPALELLPRQPGDWLLRADLFLLDRPGELAEVCAVYASLGANIESFSYNRSDDPNRARIAARIATAVTAGRLADQLRAMRHLEPPAASESAQKVQITDLSGLLKIRARLEDRPGTLAAFATVLKEHKASVIYLAYDAHRAPEVAEMSMATQSPQEVSLLLQDLNRRGYHYHVEWQGGSTAGIEQVIGLSVIERFLLGLKAVLPRERLDELDQLIRSSEELSQTLLSFRRESGQSQESMAASEVFTSILQLATTSISKTSRGFALRVTGPLALSERVTACMLSCPTGANGYLLRHGDEWTMIDTGYGLYWRDARAAMAGYGIDPAKIRRVLLTHADADHAGWAAPLQEEYGAAVLMHPDGPAVFRAENRAHGSGTRLMALNGYFTKLINRFTDLRPPRTIQPLTGGAGEVGGLKVIGRIEVGDVELLVLEGLGGHVPAQVFFYGPSAGVLFCGDYLIDFASLSEREKSALSIPKQLMTSTNSDATLFYREMRLLAQLMLDTQSRMKDGTAARIFPGHGDFYSVPEGEAVLRALLDAGNRV